MRNRVYCRQVKENAPECVHSTSLYLTPATHTYVILLGVIKSMEITLVIILQ